MDTFRIGKHVIELSMSYNSSCSPCHLEEFDKKGKTVFAMAGIGHFMRVDGASIYKMELTTYSNLKNRLSELQNEYDYYPAETEEELMLLLNSPELQRLPEVEG